MDAILNFFQTNWLYLLLLAALAAGTLLLLRFGYVKQAKAILLMLVTEAEARFGGGTGEIKFSAVASALYEHLPSAAKYLLREKTIASLIEAAVTRMKECLSESAGEQS